MPPIRTRDEIIADDRLNVSTGLTNPVYMFGINVASISVSVQWGGQGGTMQLKLVEDETNGRVLEKDADGNPTVFQTGKAAYLKYGKFYFGGIFQRWTYSEDTSSGRIYDIVLESPAKLMDGVKLIIEDFNGATDLFANQYNNNDFSTNYGSFHLPYGAINNVFNVFGSYENPSAGYYSPPVTINGLQVSRPYGDFVAQDYRVGDTVEIWNSSGSDGFYVIQSVTSKSLVLDVAGATSDSGIIRNTRLANFGSSGFNSSGMTIASILDSMDTLMKIDSLNYFGGPITFGTGDTIDDESVTQYGLDLVDLATYQDVGNVPFADYRIKGPVKSLNDLFSEMGEFFQFDYYYSLLPYNSETGQTVSTDLLYDGGGYLDDIATLDDDVPKSKAMIRVKLIDRSFAPEPNTLRKFVNTELEKPSAERILSSYNLGKEFGDTATQKIVWGGNRTRYAKLTTADCLPIAGKDKFGNYNIPGSISDVYSNISKPFSIWIKGDEFGGEGFQWQVTPFELRMALGGQEVWKIFKSFETYSGTEPNNYNNPIAAPWVSNLAPTKDVIQGLADGNKGNALDPQLTQFAKANQEFQKAKEDKASRIFQGVSDVANNSYFNEFLIRLPNEAPGNINYNIYYPGGEGASQAIKSWEVSGSAFDSAPIVGDISFYDGIGKVTSTVSYPFQSGSDFSSLGSDWAFGQNAAAGSIVTKKGSPDQESFWYLDSFYTVFKCGGQVKLYDAYTTPDFGLTVLAAYFYGITLTADKYIGPNSQNLQFAIPPTCALPSLFGIPQESGRYKYGPWVTVNKANGGNWNPNGKADVIADSSLVPETYNGYGPLQTIGSITASVGIPSALESESGTMNLVGSPSYNIGENFLNSGPYVTGMDISVDATGGITTSYKFSTWTPNFGKMAKFNIDRIATINKNNFDDAKRARDKIEKRPFPKIKFEKTDFGFNKNKNGAAGIFMFNGNGKNVNQKNQGQKGGGNKNNLGQV